MVLYDLSECTEYLLLQNFILGPEFVTEKIYPNMNSLAEKMIAENKK